MDYDALLDMAVELGYRLTMSGAETFRVEESISRVLESYGIQAEVFAIPNCLHVSIETAEGKAMTRMRRIGHHGSNLDAVEKYNSVSRRICSEHPAPEAAAQWVKDAEKACRQYSFLIHLAGCFLIAIGFAILFGGSIRDSVCAGVCGIAVGIVNFFMNKWKVNPFFQIIIASFVMAFIAYGAGMLRVVDSADITIIGTLMILVPGLLFTNALRDIIYGDTNSGTNRIVQVFLIAAALALGTGAALKLSNTIWALPAAADPQNHALIFQLLASFLGCAGFAILFNIQAPGSLLCAAGGVITWLVYRIAQHYCGDVSACFAASVMAALYAESMARIRKYPAISYLVVSLMPLIPGAGVYYTMNFIVRGDMQQAASQGIYTVAVAGAIAVGILLVSTVFRLISTHKRHR